MRTPNVQFDTPNFLLSSSAISGKTSLQTQVPERELARSSMSALFGGFNRSTQHLLILLDWEVSDGGECADVVHAETAGRALGAMEERSMCGGHRPSA